MLHTMNILFVRMCLLWAVLSICTVMQAQQSAVLRSVDAAYWHMMRSLRPISSVSGDTLLPQPGECNMLPTDPQQWVIRTDSVLVGTLVKHTAQADWHKSMAAPYPDGKPACSRYLHMGVCVCRTVCTQCTERNSCRTTDRDIALQTVPTTRIERCRTTRHRVYHACAPTRFVPPRLQCRCDGLHRRFGYGIQVARLLRTAAAHSKGSDVSARATTYQQIAVDAQGLYLRLGRYHTGSGCDRVCGASRSTCVQFAAHTARHIHSRKWQQCIFLERDSEKQDEEEYHMRQQTVSMPCGVPHMKR